MKRKGHGEDAKLKKCLSVPGASEKAVFQIWNHLHTEKKQKKAKQFLEEVKEHLGPFSDCFDPLHLTPKDPTKQKPIPFPVANVQKLLQLVVKECPSFALALQRGLKDSKWSLSPILYSDECTPLNVLLPINKMKASLFYLSFCELGCLLSSELVWLPLAFVLHGDVDAVIGGMAGVLKVLVEHMYAQNRHGFSIKFEDGMRWCKLGKFFFNGDLDSVRASFALKGSAGLRPCPHCRNIIKKNTDLLEYDDDGYFLDIASAKEDCFDKNTDEEVFQGIDFLVEEGNRLGKGQLKDLEKRVGLNLEPACIWFDKSTRSILPPSRILYDPMHCYYSCGIVNVELSLLFQAMEGGTPFNKDNLLSAALEAGWVRHGFGATRSPTLLKLLFHEKLLAGDVYKGNAAQTKSLLSLMAYYVEIFLRRQELLPGEAASFLALWNCHREMSMLKHEEQVRDVSQMRAAACKHQDLFNQAYESSSRPKHHARFHIADSAMSCGRCISCEPQEKKHQVYKSFLAPRLKQKSSGGGGGIAWAAVKRILSTQVQQINESPLCPEMTLLPPIKKAGEMQCRLLLSPCTPMAASARF